MGFFSSISSALATLKTLEKKPAVTKEDVLFKDFDAECKRLQNVDLEAPVEIEAKPDLRSQRNHTGQS